MASEFAQGGCLCRAIRYRLTNSPLIVHACHCRDCQRITGTAFVLNMWIEREFVGLESGKPQSFVLKGGSGKDHEVFFCGRCGNHVWSRYGASPGDTLLVRAGSLDEPRKIKPDVHIFTRSKQPWLELPADARVFKEFYKPAEVWSRESLARWRTNIERRSS